jgi:hypothetical protein
MSIEKQFFLSSFHTPVFPPLLSLMF